MPYTTRICTLRPTRQRDEPSHCTLSYRTCYSCASPLVHTHGMYAYATNAHAVYTQNVLACNTKRQRRKKFQTNGVSQKKNRKYLKLKLFIRLWGEFINKLQSLDNKIMVIVRNKLTFDRFSAFTITNQACHSNCSLYLLSARHRWAPYSLKS